MSDKNIIWLPISSDVYDKLHRLMYMIDRLKWNINRSQELGIPIDNDFVELCATVAEYTELVDNINVVIKEFPDVQSWSIDGHYLNYLKLVIDDGRGATDDSM